MTDATATALEGLPKKVKDFKFVIECSIRYHARRQAFFESFDRTINTINLILASGTVAWLLSGYLPKWANGSLTALIAVVTFINLNMRPSEMASRHGRLRERYNDLLKKVMRLDPDDPGCGPGMRRCEGMRLDIEHDEPPANNMVVMLAHNEQTLAQDGPETHIHHVGWWRTLTANIWRYETNSVITVAEHKAKKPQKKAKEA